MVSGNSSRCRARDVDEENKEMKEKLTELQHLLRQSEACRTELERQQRARDPPGVSSITTINMVRVQLLRWFAYIFTLRFVTRKIQSICRNVFCDSDHLHFMSTSGN